MHLLLLRAAHGCRREKARSGIEPTELEAINSLCVSIHNMRMPSRSALRSVALRHQDEICELLMDLIRFRTVQGSEAGAQRYLKRRFDELGFTTKEESVDESIRLDPEYTSSDQPHPYRSRPNLLIFAGGEGEGRTAILNTHVDVVPAGSWPGAFDPRVENGQVVGRGAVDCKGQIAALYLTFVLMKELKIGLDSRLTAQIVIEEETGGNGSLSLIRRGHCADGAVVLEGTDLTVCPANRGAIWFRAQVAGLPVHMARKFEGISAIDKSIELIRLLYRYEARLADGSMGQALFAEYDHPVQVNIGKLSAGDWPSTVPASATMEGGIGFLPNKDLESIKSEVRALPKEGDKWLAANTKIDFPGLHNDAYQIPVDHPLVRELVRSCGRAGLETRARGLIASCDARLFNKVGGMPTVVFGAGDIQEAHSNNEKVALRDLLLEACALLGFLCRWCGTRE